MSVHFEGPLDNPNVSHEANRRLDKQMDTRGLPANAARDEVPEFAALDRELADYGQSEESRREATREATHSDEILKLILETNGHPRVK